MPMDGITLGAVCCELSRELTGGKIDKIQQPEDSTLLISIRSEGKTKKLLITLGNHPRLHLTQQPYESPQLAPSFCMLLRKHLVGGRVEKITQYGNERVVFIDILSANELGDKTIKRIVVEIMGKYSNIIFINCENIVLDAIRRVNAGISRVRQVMPHDMYELPPSQGKQEPNHENIAAFLKAFPAPTAIRIAENFTGISRPAAAEMAASGEAGLLKYMTKVQMREYIPVMVLGNDGPADYLPFYYNTCGKQIPYGSFSELLDAFCSEKDLLARIRARSKELRDLLNGAAERARKKQGIYLQKMLECSDMEKLRIYGELLTANLYAVKRGSKSVSVINYYDPDGQSITIPLEQHLSPQANAQKYFKRYSKLKTASKMLSGQMSENDSELEYLESLLNSLDNCTDFSHMEEIRQELVQQGYIRAPKKPVKITRSGPMRFTAQDGTEILVGRNNLQNDELTLCTAKPDELWLHVKGSAGSHVVVRSATPQEQTIGLAACLAAYYSKARMSSNVAVDATEVKNVKKPRGAKPGMVIYETYSTYFVTPDSDTIRQLITNAL